MQTAAIFSYSDQESAVGGYLHFPSHSSDPRFIIMMLPYVWMVGSSFKAPTELSLTYFTLIPKQPTLRNSL